MERLCQHRSGLNSYGSGTMRHGGQSFLIKAEATVPMAASSTLCFWDVSSEAQPRMRYSPFLVILGALSSS